MNIKDMVGSKKNVLIATMIVIGAVIMLFCNIDINGDTQKNSKQELEQSLENIFASVEGAGNVKVFVYLSDDGVKNFEKDIRKSNDILEEKTVLNGNSPAVVKYSFPNVKGIIITARGAEDEVVKQRLAEAAETALGIPTHRICVLAGK